MRKFALPLALLFAPAMLAAWVGAMYWKVADAPAVTLPIEGYDPRHLLQGHYLTYRIIYPVEADAYCEKKREGRRSYSHKDEPPTYLCLDEGREQASSERSEACEKIVTGKCEWNRFAAGVEKYYVPEERAGILEQAVIGKRAAVRLKLPKDGKPMLDMLLVDGLPWRELKE